MTKENQFEHPHGLAGRVAGWLMAVGNADMERKAVAALPLGGDESVLEIGFGPGVGIRRLVARLPRGFVAGIDPSEVMMGQAIARNRAAVRQGRVDLRIGTASRLPWPDQSFDAVCSVNNIQMWPSLAADFGELRRVLRPGGTISIAVHRWVDEFAKDRGDATRPWDEHVVSELERSCLHVVDVRHARAVSGRAHYFFARSMQSGDAVPTQGASA